MGCLTISTNVRRYQTYYRWHFFFQEDIALVHMHCACNTVQLLRRCRLPFSWTMPPTAPSWTHCLQDLGSHTAAYESWVKKTEESRSDWLNSGKALIQHLSEKNAISCFPVLPGSAEAQVILGGTVKRILIAYFIGNISAKKYQNAFTYVKVTGNQRWDVFWDTVYMLVFHVKVVHMHCHCAIFWLYDKHISFSQSTSGHTCLMLTSHAKYTCLLAQWCAIV